MDTPLVVALQYDDGHDIPMQENEALVTLPVHVKLGEEIPEALYPAAAQVIAFACHLSGKSPR